MFAQNIKLLFSGDLILFISACICVDIFEHMDMTCPLAILMEMSSSWPLEQIQTLTIFPQLEPRYEDLTDLDKKYKKLIRR